MTSIEIRVRDLYDDLNDSEKKAASFFLSHVDSVFVLPIAKLAKQADTTQVAWVRLCKHIGFDGLKDMKKALFNELNETNAPTAQRESSGFFTDIRDYNTITEMADAVKTSSICAIEDTMKLLDPAIVERAAGKIIQADSVRLFGVNASSLVAQDLYYKLIRIGKSACYAQDLHIQLTYAATMGPKECGHFCIQLRYHPRGDGVPAPGRRPGRHHHCADPVRQQPPGPGCGPVFVHIIAGNQPPQRCNEQPHCPDVHGGCSVHRCCPPQLPQSGNRPGKQL